MAFLAPNDILVLEKEKGTVDRIVNGNLIAKPLLKVNVASEVERAYRKKKNDNESIISRLERYNLKTGENDLTDAEKQRLK